ncbi:hypothetical protein E2C01_085979 [Portunus trituberculatus]|uniref:Uncharacterized protein n=1 Tax=Portunus trituberculatus TaxID=210409 RepID=A0A5B7IZJ6_PORTR|nr:hypothetical protein [Portunus trituberculatus]
MHVYLAWRLPERLQMRHSFLYMSPCTEWSEYLVPSVLQAVQADLLVRLTTPDYSLRFYAGSCQTTSAATKQDKNTLARSGLRPFQQLAATVVEEPDHPERG